VVGISWAEGCTIPIPADIFLGQVRIRKHMEGRDGPQLTAPHCHSAASTACAASLPASAAAISAASAATATTDVDDPGSASAAATASATSALRLGRESQHCLYYHVITFQLTIVALMI